MTVLRTLAYLKSTAKISFEYTPQINIYDDLHSNKPCGDIDIVCLINGKLVIGEAKHTSTLFKEENYKCLQNLVDISKETYPDEIILSCYEDPNGALAKAETGLKHLFNRWEYTPKIFVHKLHKPDYSNISNQSHRYFHY